MQISLNKVKETLDANGNSTYFDYDEFGRPQKIAHPDGGRVVGVIPAKLRKREVAYEEADEMIVTAGMSDRKEILIRESDAFIVLPGGFGTLDELLDVRRTSSRNSDRAVAAAVRNSSEEKQPGGGGADGDDLFVKPTKPAARPKKTAKKASAGGSRNTEVVKVKMSSPTTTNKKLQKK